MKPCQEEAYRLWRWATKQDRALAKATDANHQSTLDQFFSESQFESYRALGLDIASNVFEPAFKGPVDARWPTDKPLSKLFQDVNDFWIAQGTQ